MPVHRCCKRCKKYLENILKKVVDKKEVFVYNNSCVTERNKKTSSVDKVFQPIGVWLSLARAPGLGPGGRRFESCHPDLYEK